MLEILPDELTPGLVVAGRYRLDGIVGEGGMGIVWSATHVLTEKKCALKFLKESRASDPRNHQRLLQEARSACAVRHPNVAQVHDILELASGVPFIVMDLLEGESLAALLARVGKLDITQTIRILQPVSDAVAAAHKLGIVHRDLKPDNVFIETSNGRDVVKVLDFGIAKRLGGGVESSRAVLQRLRERSRLTTTYSVVGTPLYMAPEQVNGPGEFAEQVDVWSLGVIAYECVTGKRPAGIDEIEQVDTRLLARSIDSLPPEVPPQFARLIRRMLQVDPARRATLAEVRDALLLQSPDLGTTISVDAVTTEIAASAQRSRNWQRALPWGLVAMGAAGFIVFSRFRDEPQALSGKPAAPVVAEDVAFEQSAFRSNMLLFPEAPRQQTRSSAPSAQAVLLAPSAQSASIANAPAQIKRAIGRRVRASAAPSGSNAIQFQAPPATLEKAPVSARASGDGIPTYDRK